MQFIIQSHLYLHCNLKRLLFNYSIARNGNQTTKRKRCVATHLFENFQFHWTHNSDRPPVSIEMKHFHFAIIPSRKNQIHTFPSIISRLQFLFIPRAPGLSFIDYNCRSTLLVNSSCIPGRVWRIEVAAVINGRSPCARWKFQVSSGVIKTHREVESRYSIIEKYRLHLIVRRSIFAGPERAGELLLLAWHRR